MRDLRLGWILVLALPLVPALVAACGGDDSNPSGSSATTTGSGGAGAGGAGAGAGGAGGGAGGSSSGELPTFERILVDSVPGAAWVSIADIDDDGKLDLVVSGFGTVSGMSIPNGEVRLYTQGATLSDWTLSPIVPASEGVKFPNRTTLADVDGDGDLDVILPAGFLVCTVIPGGQPCGALLWYEQAAAGWVRHEVVPGGAQLFYHSAEHVDFDGDGVKDLVTVGEAKGSQGPMTPDQAKTQWFKGTQGPERIESTPREVGDGLGSLPSVADLDGDGDLDVLSAEFFVPEGSFAWMERTQDPGPNNPAGTFVRRVIDADSGPSIMLQLVPDLYGDGVLRAVGTNHTNTAKSPPDAHPEAVFVFDIPADPTQPWTKTAISTGIQSVPGSIFAPQAAPGIFAPGDVNGDGDIDLVVSGDGDPRVLWLDQIAPEQWETRVLEADLAQAGGLHVVDLDGDGRNEIVVTGYVENALYVYVRQP